MTHPELETLLQTAEEDNRHGNYANAEKLAREVLQRMEESKTSASETLHIRALLALSESLLEQGQAKEALLLADQTFTMSSDVTSPERKKLSERAFRLMGNANIALSQYTEALEYHRKALELGEELGDQTAMAGATCNIANVYFYIAEYSKALEYYQKALDLNDNVLGSKTWTANITGNIGGLYHNLSEYAKALEYSEKALILFAELGDKAGEALQTGTIGSIYYCLSEYLTALEYNQKALALNEELGRQSGIAVQNANVGLVYMNLFEYTKALEYLMKALKLSEDIGDKRHAGYCLSHIGDTLQKMGRNKEAMEYLQHSIHIREQIESNENVAYTLILIGSLLNKEYRLDDAKEKLEEALTLAGQLGEKKGASDTHKELAEVYKKQGDAVKSLEHLEKYLALDKEIFSDDTRKRMEAFNFRVATANKERDLKLAQQEAEVNRLKAEQAEQTVRLKERELANTASSLAAQTELLGEFRADLRKIVMRPDKVSAEDIIRQVRTKLKELPCEMIDFGKFEAQFATVHPEFRAKLETTYPDLTPQEIKICMLMHVNLQTAAIARLTCLSERTVESHRLSVRKKMCLEREDNLLDVLRKLDGTTPRPPPTPSS